MILQRRQMSADVPAMAMGDIAFLLLIFFIILARVTDDSHVKVNKADGTELQKPQSKRVGIAIDTNQITYLNGVRINPDMISDALYQPEAPLGQRGLLGDQPPGQRTVLLKIDKNTPASLFEPVIEAVSKAGGELHHVLEERN
jgi:biopolymer transport protein ExbD